MGLAESAIGDFLDFWLPGQLFIEISGEIAA